MVHGVDRCLARFVGVCVLTLLTFFGEVTAWAEDAKESATVVILVEGGGGAKLRTAISAQLPDPWALAEPNAVAAAAKKRKLPQGLNSLNEPKAQARYQNSPRLPAFPVGL